MADHTGRLKENMDLNLTDQADSAQRLRQTATLKTIT